MKQAPLLSALLAPGLLFLASCKNRSAGGNLPIPKDAAIAVHIDNSSLASKLNWNEIKATTWFKELSTNEDDSLAKKLLDNPEAAGMNVKEDMAFFVQKRGKATVGVFEGTVKDAAAFEQFNTSLLQKKGSAAQVEKEGNISTLKMDENVIVSWDANRFTYAFASDMMSRLNQAYEFDEEQPKKTVFGTDSLKAYIKYLYNLGGDALLTSDDRYEDLLKEKGDVHFWMNSEEYYNMISEGAMSLMSMMKFTALIENSVSASTLSFDDGQITVKSKQYVSEDMEKLIKKHNAKNVSASLINRIPSQNVLGVMAVNYPSEGVRDLFKMIGVDGLVNTFLGRAGLSMDDFINAYNGDMLVAISDLTIKEEKKTFEGTSYTYTSTKPDVKLLFALSVKDRNSFEKLWNTATEDFRNDGDFAKNVKYKLGNDWFAAGNDAAYVDRFIAGGNNNIPFASKISGHPFGMYVDIQKIMRSALPSGKEKPAGFDESMKMWQDVVITGGDYKNGYITSEMVVNLVDRNTNALKQLNTYFDKVAAANKSKAASEEWMAPDTSVIAPPPVEALDN